jgi:hypothetical protein
MTTPNLRSRLEGDKIMRPRRVLIVPLDFALASFDSPLDSGASVE